MEYTQAAAEWEDGAPCSPSPKDLHKRSETYVCTQERTGTFTAIVFMIGPNWKQPQMSFKWLQVNALQSILAMGQDSATKRNY